VELIAGLSQQAHGNKVVAYGGRAIGNAMVIGGVGSKHIVFTDSGGQTRREYVIQMCLRLTPVAKGDIERASVRAVQSLEAKCNIHSDWCALYLQG
jgi:hypothetical protein